jgi:hypothetical protein
MMGKGLSQELQVVGRVSDDDDLYEVYLAVGSWNTVVTMRQDVERARLHI